MRRLVMLVVLVLLPLLGAGCPRPWAEVPQNVFGIPQCAAIDPVMDACEWAGMFDDLLVFNIDDRVDLNEPVTLDTGVDVPPEERDRCRIISAGLALYGSTVRSAHGASPIFVLIPGDHEAIDVNHLRNGTRVLVAIKRNNEQNDVRRFWIEVADDDTVTQIPGRGCAQSDEVVGRNVDDLIDAVQSCPPPIAGVPPSITGAVCFE